MGIDGFADAFLAEHVWEHLSLEDAHRATRNCYRFLRPGGRLRLAVPDPDWYLFPLKSGARNSGEKQSQASQSPGEAGSLPGKANGHRDRKKRKAEKVARRASSRELPVWLSFAMVAADIRDGHLVQYTPELLANVCWSAGFKPILVEGGSRIRGRRPMSKRHVHGEDEDGRSLKTGLSDEGAEGSWFRPGAGEDDVEGDVDSSLWGFVKRWCVLTSCVIVPQHLYLKLFQPTAINSTRPINRRKVVC